MSQIYNKMRINVKEKITDIVTAVQNDANSRFLDVFLYDDGLPINLTGNEVRIYMKKPDGQEIFNDGEITDAVAGRCQFELTSQALAAYGVLKVEISIWKDNTEILTTQTFHIFITQSLRSDNSIESSNEYGALVILFQNLYEAYDLMQDMIDNFGQPGSIANQYDVKTFWAISEAILQALKNSSTDAIMEKIGETTDTIQNGTVLGYSVATYDLLKNQKHGSQNFSTPGTFDFTVPEGVENFIVTIQSGSGGGGGGGGGQGGAGGYGSIGGYGNGYGVGGYGGGGGGAGGNAIQATFVVNLTNIPSVSVVVGNGGNGGSGGYAGGGGTGGRGASGSNGGTGYDGNYGGSSSFGSISIPGGAGGNGGRIGGGGQSNPAAINYGNINMWSRACVLFVYGYPFPDNAIGEGKGSAGGSGSNSETSSVVGSGGSGGSVNYIPSFLLGGNGGRGGNGGLGGYGNSSGSSGNSGNAGANGKNGFVYIVW